MKTYAQNTADLYDRYNDRGGSSEQHTINAIFLALRISEDAGMDDDELRKFWSEMAEWCETFSRSVGACP